MVTSKAFDSKTVSLEKKNLIESSAGTGKTFSIAIMVLRVVIEKGIPLQKILMVTFTNAAVAELELRVRRFIRRAYRYSLDSSSEAEEKIKELLKYLENEKGIDIDLIRQRLYGAVQSLDELNVMTIHSFCERCLMQYPFETGLPFRFDISTDISDIRDMVVNDYWRRKITTLDADLYRHFTGILTRDMIREVLNKALDDKEYICGEINEDEVLLQIKDFIKQTEAKWKAFDNYVRSNFKNIIAKKHKDHNAKKLLNDYGSSPGVFMDAYIEKYESDKRPQYIEYEFPDEFRLYSGFFEQKNTLDEISKQYIYHLFKLNIEEFKNSVAGHKASIRIIDFNDQVRLLYQSVDNTLLKNVLASKYDAVFIDEFQDTDRCQYEIFTRLFSGKIIFYIGDPKQSIYGWRKADIATYKKAKENVDAIHSMKQNFRSTAELIDSLNSFFSTDDPFADPDIKYEKVEMGLANLGSMTENNVAVVPFEIFGFSNKPGIEDFVVNEIGRLISSTETKIKTEKIKPSDIAIIVRSNNEGRAFKKALSGAGIPAITIDDARVMCSDEAQVIRYLMEAVIQPNRGALNRVLLNPYFGINSKFVEILDDEEHLEQFRELKKTWHETGIYNMLFRFFDMYQVRHYGLEMGIEGQRTLTNLYQVAEILHQAELENKYTPNELWEWSKRAQYDDNDEYEQRVESQDDAVQITTIHKCKGLTYNIVFAPYLDLKVKEYPVYEFRDQGMYKFTHNPSEEQKKLWHEQIEQENRRLIYVALTRARYKVYLCINNSSGNKDSSIKKFPVENQKRWNTDEDDALPGGRPEKQEPAAFSPRPIPGINIKSTFGIHSYSALSNAFHSAPFEKAQLAERYDQFIFQDLGRGANVGTALHSIFERLDFDNPGTWDQTLKNASKYYSNIIREEYSGYFKQLLKHTMSAEIHCAGESIKLQHIPNEKKLPELEFYFSIDSVNKKILNEILGEEADLVGETDLEGLMTGFVDLVFEHNGKFYILDWKSNHLGNATENYDRQALTETMKLSNYNLQYMIYTVAVKRWLESRIKGFDYDKHFGGIVYVFLRGVREGRETGIFTTRPAKDTIENLDDALKSN